MNDADLDSLIDAGARLLGIDIRPEWCDSIRLNLAISLGHARTVGEFRLPDEAEPAPIFLP
jgi:hypothetical protein